MVKEVVRYGSLQGRRGRLPSKVKSSTQSDQPPSPPMPILTVITKAFADARPSNLLISPRTDKSVSLSSIANTLDYEIQSLIRFIHKIPDIGDISDHDLRLLTLRNFFPFFAIKHVHRLVEMKNLQMGNEFCFDDNTIILLNNVPAEFSQLFSTMASFVDQFQSDVDWDVSSFASLLVLQFLAVDQSKTF
jgi:hypothetical protein